MIKTFPEFRFSAGLVYYTGHRDNDFLAKNKVPENFGFVLDYFCASVGLNCTEVMADLGWAENEIRRAQPDYFGTEFSDF